jgi:uncharacterized damage-inducible protein DinB
MSEAHALSNRIVRTLTGPMWHGASLDELLRDVTYEQAAMRPSASVHTIWELVLHIITWVDVPRERLGGNPRTDVTMDEDWPRMPPLSAVTWSAVVRRLEEQHRALAGVVARLSDADLDGRVAGHEYTAREMLHGVVEHGTYHGGQIAILKKMLAGS